MSERAAPVLSVVLGVMGRVELAEYGFRSWMLQEIDQQYEVVLCLFNDQKSRFEKLAEDCGPRCQVVIREYDPPAFFNISAANNLGIHWARGEFLMFANSDVVYPSHFATSLIREMKRGALSYAVASRVDMPPGFSRSLKPALQHGGEAAFDYLAQHPDLDDSHVWRGGNGWITTRNAIRSIGGFDPRILVMEDQDLSSRMMHFLRRSGEQESTHGLMDLYGFHLYHQTSDIFDAKDQASEIISARSARLAAAPDCEDDVVSTDLDSHEKLLADVAATVKPPPFARYRKDVVPKTIRRIRAAARILVGRKPW